MKEWLRDKMKLILADLQKIHKSLTMWFVGVMTIIGEILPYLIDTFPELQPYIPENTYQTVMRVLVVGSIIIRFRTTTALRNK